MMKQRKTLIPGWILSGLVIAFMLFDATLKLLGPQKVVDATVLLGYGKHHIPVLGLLGLVSTLLYAFPRTSVLGAILLTGYFGGAIATNLRVDAPLFSHILFPVYFGILMWGGLFLRNTQLRALFPITK